MKTETLETRVKRITKRAKHKLAKEPISHHAIDGEIFWFKRTLVGVYYYTERTNKQNVLVSIYGNKDLIMPYYLKCIVINNKETDRNFYQTCSLDIDFSEYNDMLNEIMDETLKVIIKKEKKK